MAEALLPLVELIAEQTGTCISVFVGRPPSKNADTRKFFLRAVHCGTAGPKQLEWSDFDPDGFRVATSKFSSFVSKANSKFSSVFVTPTLLLIYFYST